MTAEHKIQNEIRNALAGKGSFFRGNVGQAWQGEVTRLRNGDIMLTNPRPFTSGLPKGFSDLFGWVSVEVTPDMVGQKVAVFAGVEVKTDKGRVTPEQERFLQAVRKAGGRSCIAKNISDLSKLGVDLYAS